MIHVAIGANLPDDAGRPALHTCRAAAAALARLPGLRQVGQSRWYESGPQPPSAQPNYINGIVALDGLIAPEHLLALLHDIEHAAGRRRAEPNAARPLDLDIIDMDGLLREMPDPILPHPRAHLRAFVLLPLRDVAPGWVHPASGHSIDVLLATMIPPLAEQPIRALD